MSVQPGVGAQPMHRTLAEAAFPAARIDPRARRVLLVIGGAGITALAAQLAFSVPWTPVPYTGQTAAVLLVGTALGWRLGAASMLLYVLAGAAGAPVFADGAHGAGQLIGATGGYLVGFVAAAALTGRLAQAGWDRSPLRAAGLMFLGNLAIYAVGVPILALVLAMPAGEALQVGALVFLPWDALKIALAAGLLPAAWRLAGRR